MTWDSNLRPDESVSSQLSLSSVISILRPLKETQSKDTSQGWAALTTTFLWTELWLWAILPFKFHPLELQCLLVYGWRTDNSAFLRTKLWLWVILPFEVHSLESTMAPGL